MGLMDKLSGQVMQGILGNMNEIPVEELEAEFGDYLMEGETIHTGFKLVRDAMIITDRRILEIDKQGATGQKMRVNSIYLNSIFNVSVETAGFGLDDSELEIEYIATPYLKAHGVKYATKKFEFPKRYNIQWLYRMLQEVSYDNYVWLNE